MAEGGDGFWRPLGCQLPVALAIAPELGIHQQIALQGIVLFQGPFRVQMLAALQVGLGQALQGQFHRVHRIAAAGQHGPLQQGVEGFCQGHAGLPELASRPGEQVLHRHAVLGEGAGLVDRQHGGATEALDCRGGAGQHADARQAQGPQGQKQGQHHRDFVGQHRQGQGQGGQQGAGPIAAETPLQHRQAGAQPQGPNRQAA